MLSDIREFMNNIEVVTDGIALYKDEEKGIIFPLNVVNLIARVDYLELEKEQYNIAKFQKKIDDIDYNIINVKKPVPKNEITKKDEDKYTIVEKEVAVRQVWNVSNTAGAFKSFTNKEEAIKEAEEINTDVFKYLKSLS